MCTIACACVDAFDSKISKGKDAYPTCTAIFLSDTDCGRVLTLCAGSALLSFHGRLCDSVS